MNFVVAVALFWAAVSPAQTQKESPLVLEGDQRYNVGNIDGSIDSYSRALLANPGLAAAYARRGRSYRAKNEFDKALADLDHAVNLLPKDPWSRREREIGRAHV